MTDTGTSSGRKPRIEVFRVSRNADASRRVHSRPSWIVPDRDKPWCVVEVSLQDSDVERYRLVAGFGSDPAQLKEVTWVSPPTAQTSLEALQLEAPSSTHTLFVAALDEKDEPIARAQIAVVPRWQARLAWVVLTSLVAVAAIRLGVVASVLSGTVAALLALLVGGGGLYALIVSRFRLLLHWLRKVDAPLFGVFRPHVALAALVGALAVCGSFWLTSLVAIIVNRTELDTTPDIGFNITPGSIGVFASPPRLRADSKLALYPAATISASHPLLPLLEWPWSPRAFDLNCRQRIFVDDARRLIGSSKGVYTNALGKALLKLTKKCDAESAQVIVRSLDRSDARLPAGGAWSDGVAMEVNQAWTAGDEVPPGKGRLVVGSTSGDRGYWVRVAKRSDGLAFLNWIALRLDQPAQTLAWRPLDFSLLQAPDGEALGRLEAAECGDSPRLHTVAFVAGNLANVELWNDRQSRVMRWEPAKAAPILLCGSGSDLRISFTKDSREPDAQMLSLPGDLGIRTIRIQVGDVVLGESECPVGGDVFAAPIPASKECSRSIHSPSKAVVWKGDAHPLAGWPSPWFCYRKGAAPHSAVIERAGGKGELVKIVREGEGLRIQRRCGARCDCMLGDVSMPQSDCPGGCAPTTKVIAGCAKVTECVR